MLGFLLMVAGIIIMAMVVTYVSRADKPLHERRSEPRTNCRYRE